MKSCLSPEFKYTKAQDTTPDYLREKFKLLRERLSKSNVKTLPRVKGKTKDIA